MHTSPRLPGPQASAGPAGRPGRLAAQRGDHLADERQMLLDPRVAAEPVTRVTYEIKEGKDGVCSLTLIHELDGAPRLAALVGGQLEDQGAGGGWAWILSDLKTLLETGTAFAG
jgi:hypothetical protein